MADPPATPLEFHVEFELPDELALDQLVFCERQHPEHGRIYHCGVVDEVCLGEVNFARVRVIRISPEVMVAPLPGSEVAIPDARSEAWVLQFPAMKRKFPIGVLASGGVAYANTDFLTGEKGAHLNISGISGVATKTSYALFLLYSLFNSDAEGNYRAIVFNVKGDDLLYLHEKNQQISERTRQVYEKLGLACQPFLGVTYHGGKAGLWTLKQFAERELVRFLFAEPDQSGVMEFAVERLAELLRECAALSEGSGLKVGDQVFEQLSQWVAFLVKEAADKDSPWFESVTQATRQAVLRRLKANARQVESLIGPSGSFHYDAEMNVVDIHHLPERARAFVVGSVLKSVYEGRESLGDEHPITFIMIDELNKYAPRAEAGLIRDVLLDVAERGRSLRIVLVGAQQTASQVEDRVVGNAALRIVGRLESAESQKEQYGFLSATLRQRATLLLPGTMIVAQPEIPVPLPVTFPFPCWATRRSEVEREPQTLESIRQSFKLPEKEAGQ